MSSSSVAVSGRLGIVAVAGAAVVAAVVGRYYSREPQRFGKSVLG